MKRLAVLPLAAIILAACQDVPTSITDSPQFEIMDAVHSDGNPHFFFLPPMVPDPSASFTEAPFDGSLDVLVEICVWNTQNNACGPSFELYNMVSGPGSETVRVSGEHYIVNWHTDGILDDEELALGEYDVYRIRIMVGDRELGHADVDVVGTGKELKNVDTDEFIPLLDGRTLPIKFRIEEGALGYGVLVTAGSNHTCGLTPDGAAYCWGNGYYGQLGHGRTTIKMKTPVAVEFAGQFGSLAAGYSHTCGLTPDGTAYCWGAGRFGQRGDGTTARAQTTPVAVEFTGQFASLTAGEYHTCGLTPDGTAYCWGNGSYGQLGDGNATYRQTTPAPVTFTDHFAALTAGDHHTCGVTTDGAAYCWGNGSYGQLGDGNTTRFQKTPVAVTFTGQFASLTAGEYHTCGLTPDGTAYCWGNGSYGQLGIGNTYRQLIPVAVTFTGQFASLAAGSNHTCGVATEGTAYCWGNGSDGQLGDGNLWYRYRQTTPVAVEFTGQFASLTAGSSHTCGVTTEGAAYCWGNGHFGQRGDGYLTLGQATPVAVLGFPPVSQ